MRWPWRRPQIEYVVEYRCKKCSHTDQIHLYSRIAPKEILGVCTDQMCNRCPGVVELIAIWIEEAP